MKKYINKKMDYTNMKVKLEVLELAKKQGKSIKEVLEDRKREINWRTYIIFIIVELLMTGLELLDTPLGIRDIDFKINID